MLEVVPLSDFQHGHRAFRDGVPVSLPESTANDLERAGLVRVKMAPALANKMAPDPLTKGEPPGKARADGEGTPSASLQAAPVSPATIAAPPKRGRGRPRKIVT